MIFEAEEGVTTVTGGTIMDVVEVEVDVVDMITDEVRCPLYRGKIGSALLGVLLAINLFANDSSNPYVAD